VEQWDGLSSMIERHARASAAELGKAVSTAVVPVTTLAALCAERAPRVIDFLKIDVEGAERDVLVGADWQQFRPKVVLVEAFAPDTFEPAWDDWEPILTANGYHYVFTDDLNRYYVAEEAADLARRFAAAPASFDDTAVLFGTLQYALTEPRHPDHDLANRLARAAMAELPLLDPVVLAALLTANVAPAELERPASAVDIRAVFRQLFKSEPDPAWVSDVLRGNPSNRDVYGKIVASDAFRAACGRICASYAY
jgi:hypothetical protein